MTKETVLLRQNFRSKINFLQDYFKSDLVKDVQSGDSMGQIALEKTIPQTYPLIIDVSGDLLSDDRACFETHVLSFLFYHGVNKSANLRVYYALGHRCDYDKSNNSLGLTSPNSINLYAIVTEGKQVHSITARQLGKNKTQFEKNVPLIMCSYTFLPPSPLLIDDSGYLDSLYCNVTKESKKYCQAFNSALEAVNTTILEEIKHPLTCEALYLYFLNVLLEHEHTKKYKEMIEDLMNSFHHSSIKVPLNAMTFTPKEGVRRMLPSSANARDFFSNTMEVLKERACDREEREVLEQLKNHFSRQLGFDSGPLKLDQIISKPILKPIKASVNEYDVKDFDTRPFSPTRIQPLNTLLTDQEYKIASNYQGSKESVETTEWSSNAYPMLIVEPTAKSATKNLFHFHFIAFTLKEAYTKAINANTMYRFLGYGYPFYFDGEAFKLDEEKLNLYSVILKKGTFTSFSTLDYLSFYERQPHTISLNGKRPSPALDTKFPSAQQTLALAVKNREKIKNDANTKLIEINASYGRFLKKSKKQPSNKTALEYVSNMMGRTAKLEFDTPSLAVNINVNDDQQPTSVESKKVEAQQDQTATTVESTSEAVVVEQPNQEDVSTVAVQETSSELPPPLPTTEVNNDTDQEDEACTPSIVVEFSQQESEAVTSTDDQADSELEQFVLDGSKTIYVNQPMTALDLPPIVEQNLDEQEQFNVEFIHTPESSEKIVSDNQVQEIIKLTKPEPKPESEYVKFDVDRSEIIRTQSNEEITVIDQPNNDVFSMFSNLGVVAEEWTSLDYEKFNYMGISICLGKKHLYILEPNTDQAIEFSIKQIISKTDDYYLLKRAVGKSLAKDLRRFVKLKLDQNFLAKFSQI